MLNWLTRWRLARSMAVHAPVSGGDEAARYVEQVRRVEARLTREAPLDMESPPLRLRRRTLDALHEITLYRRRRPVVWWQRPPVAAAFAAVVALLIGALAGLLTVGADPYARYGRSVGSTGDGPGGLSGDSWHAAGADRLAAGSPWGQSGDEPPAVLQIIYELDAMASDARRAADYLVSQFTAASRAREQSRGNTGESTADGIHPTNPSGGSAPPSNGPRPNGGQAPRPQ